MLKLIFVLVFLGIFQYQSCSGNTIQADDWRRRGFYRPRRNYPSQSQTDNSQNYQNSFKSTFAQSSIGINGHNLQKQEDFWTNQKPENSFGLGSQNYQLIDSSRINFGQNQGQTFGANNEKSQSNLLSNSQNFPRRNRFGSNSQNLESRYSQATESQDPFGSRVKQNSFTVSSSQTNNQNYPGSYSQNIQRQNTFESGYSHKSQNSFGNFGQNGQSLHSFGNFGHKSQNHNSKNIFQSQNAFPLQNTSSQNHQTYRAPGYLPPYKGPEYLPPKEPRTTTVPPYVPPKTTTTRRPFYTTTTTRRPFYSTTTTRRPFYTTTTTRRPFYTTTTKRPIYTTTTRRYYEIVPDTMRPIKVPIPAPAKAEPVPPEEDDPPTTTTKRPIFTTTTTERPIDTTTMTSQPIYTTTTTRPITTTTRRYYEIVTDIMRTPKFPNPAPAMAERVPPEEDDPTTTTPSTTTTTTPSTTISTTPSTTTSTTPSTTTSTTPSTTTTTIPSTTISTTASTTISTTPLTTTTTTPSTTTTTTTTTTTPSTTTTATTPSTTTTTTPSTTTAATTPSTTTTTTPSTTTTITTPSTTTTTTPSTTTSTTPSTTTTTPSTTTTTTSVVITTSTPDPNRNLIEEESSPTTPATETTMCVCEPTTSVTINPYTAPTLPPVKDCDSLDPTTDSDQSSSGDSCTPTKPPFRGPLYLPPHKTRVERATMNTLRLRDLEGKPRPVWYAGIYRKTSDPYYPICGGSIVKENVVISAAHCFWSDDSGVQPARLFAVAARKIYKPWKDPMDKNAQKSDVLDIKIPPRYLGAKTSFQEDLAIVTLATPFKYNKGLRPICVNFDNELDKEQMRAGHYGTFAGWGLTDAEGTPTQRLLWLELPYVEIEKCIQDSEESFLKYITCDKVCAGENDSGKALCRGDSGGGLVFWQGAPSHATPYLRGVASTAPAARSVCNVFAYASFTHVRAHRTYLREHVPGIEECRYWNYE